MDSGNTAGGRLVGGRYQLIAQIGQGGMGRVWEARDTQLGRSVAVKEVLLPMLPPEQQEIRLQQAMREARNAAAFADHPNIVTVHDVVLENGTPWIVMQLVKGRSLHQALRDPEGTGSPRDPTGDKTTPLYVPQVTRVAAAMLDALGAMHREGLVHRDVKPHNIMLADDGQVLLTDFGIAKSGSDVTVTVSGSVIGTIAYIAPERAEGEPGTAASDLFSLGVTLFEAVEGYSPFEKPGSVTGTLTALLTKPLPPMTKAGPLAPLIHALTLKAPAERPDNAQARALLADGSAAGWTPPSEEVAPTQASQLPQLPQPARSRPASQPVQPQQPATVTATVRRSDPRPVAAPHPAPAPAPKPKPRPTSTPTPTPTQTQTRKPANLAIWAVAAAVLVLGLASINPLIKHFQHKNTTAAACATWTPAYQQHLAWTRVHAALVGDDWDKYQATEYQRMSSVDRQAATQTSDPTLLAALQKAATDNDAAASGFLAVVGTNTVSTANYVVANEDNNPILTACNAE